MPIKRHKDLQPISRDHHHALLLSWKIRQGFSRQIDPARMKKYSDWFYENHLKPHFEIEEKYLFPIMEENNELVKKALSEHRRIIKLITADSDFERTLSLLEEELENHIRFEERILFKEIQERATPEQMKTISRVHKDEAFVENTEDEFWR
ncbi:MAG TPA: hemerythrin domain-containing protein [Fulvivirga sp.]|nr:hemerythrin domain-containing protein [Fulvivirga sp.]